MYHLFSFLNRYEQRLAAWATFAAFGFAIFGLSPVQLTTTTREIIYLSGIIAAFLGGTATVLLMSIHLYRRSRHAEAAANIEEAVRKITAECMANYHSVEERKRILSCAMDDLSKAFSVVTGSNCRSCVKMVVMQDGKFHTETFCRNRDYRGAEAIHPIGHNTDFNDLFQDKHKLWFFGNNLPALASAGKYLNTNTEWKSRYRSTLIWPIRCEFTENDEEPEFLGFLCVDSKRTMPFSEEYDYPLGAIVAAVLRPFLIQIARSLKEPMAETKDILPVTPDSVRLPTPVDSPAEGKPTTARLKGKTR